MRYILILSFFFGCKSYVYPPQIESTTDESIIPAVLQYEGINPLKQTCFNRSEIERMRNGNDSLIVRLNRIFISKEDSCIGMFYYQLDQIDFSEKRRKRVRTLCDHCTTYFVLKGKDSTYISWETDSHSLAVDLFMIRNSAKITKHDSLKVRQSYSRKASGKYY